VRMRFGKYKGYEVADLPRPYLEWLLGVAREPLLSAVRRALGEEKPAARAISPAVKAMAREIVSQGYRSLAQKHHPDRGGNHEDMVLVNKAKELLDRAAA
jgi:Putative quorum-sensing-regulated virulence factor